MVVPAYNEERRIARTLDSFVGTLLKRYRGMTIVVSVQGNDRTAEMVRRYSKAHPQIRLQDNRGTLGKGLNLMHGFGAALKLNPDVIGFTDADPSVPPEELAKLIDSLAKGKLSGVIASRYMEGSRILGDHPASRLIASRAYNLMVRMLFGMHFTDTQCGAKFFRASALKSILRDVQLTDMSFDINLLYELSRRNLPVREIPITYHVVNEESKVDVSRQIPKMFVVTFCYRITRSPINRIIPESFKVALYNWVRSW
jgi:glycosyltransferase involved in cell wall biosynthesis